MCLCVVCVVVVVLFVCDVGKHIVHVWFNVVLLVFFVGLCGVLLCVCFFCVSGFNSCVVVLFFVS